MLQCKAKILLETQFLDKLEYNNLHLKRGEQFILQSNEDKPSDGTSLNESQNVSCFEKVALLTLYFSCIIARLLCSGCLIPTGLLILQLFKILSITFMGNV